VKCRKCDKEAQRKDICNSCRGKEWYADNKENVSKRKKKWYENNREITIDRVKNWRQSNPEKVKQIDANRDPVNNAKYYKDRYQNDLNYRLKVILRNRISTALKHNFKSGHTIEMLGCSIEEFKLYMESKFQPGMTWENHKINGWHIDHIVPLIDFDLSDPQQLKKASHYTNLQPLWWQDNLAKRNVIKQISL
jgi:hypothetical protein